jgi:hypothetical protein
LKNLKLIRVVSFIHSNNSFFDRYYVFSSPNEVLLHAFHTHALSPPSYYLHIWFVRERERELYVKGFF